MSTIDPSILRQPGLALRQEAGDAARSAPGSSPDFDFWRRVFDDARGSGVATGEAPADTGAHASGAGAKAAVGITGIASTMVGPDAARPHAAQPQAASRLASEHLARADGKTGSGLITIGGRVFPSSPSTQASPAPGTTQTRLHALQTQDAQAGRRSPMPEGARSAAEPTPTGLQAHVVQTASGNWKVTLRSRHPLSVAQALAAVAEAIGQPGMPRGQVEQVLLNGRPIYQPSLRAGGAPGIVFELHC